MRGLQFNSQSMSFSLIPYEMYLGMMHLKEYYVYKGSFLVKKRAFILQGKKS